MRVHVCCSRPPIPARWSRRADSTGAVPRTAASQRSPAIRAAGAVASGLSVRKASSAGGGETRKASRPGAPALRGQETSSGHRAKTCCLTKPSGRGESVTARIPALTLCPRRIPVHWAGIESVRDARNPTLKAAEDRWTSSTAPGLGGGVVGEAGRGWVRLRESDRLSPARTVAIPCPGTSWWSALFLDMTAPVRPRHRDGFSGFASRQPRPREVTCSLLSEPSGQVSPGSPKGSGGNRRL